MLLRLSVAAMTRWHCLTSSEESDRGDSPVPTVIIWIGIAAIAAGVLTWAALYINHYENRPIAPVTPYTPGVASGGPGGGP
jgi:hypothetical protein